MFSCLPMDIIVFFYVGKHDQRIAALFLWWHVCIMSFTQYTQKIFMKCTVIIPAYNEEKGLSTVLDELHRLYPQTEIIVVDDGSLDRTAEVAKDKKATVVRHPMNIGYGRSLKDGIIAATNDIIVITDADGSYPIEKIGSLVSKLEEGFDMVVGARSGSAYRGSLLKMPARIVFKWLVEFATGRLIPDINSGLRVFRKSTVMKYFSDICDGFSFTTTITLIYMLTGKTVTYIPISYHQRVGHSKVRIVRDTLRTLQYITETMALYNPLKLFLLLSGVLLAISVLCFGIQFFYIDFISIILGSMSLVGSFIVFSLGLVTFSLTKGRRE